MSPAGPGISVMRQTMDGQAKRYTPCVTQRARSRGAQIAQALPGEVELGLSGSQSCAVAGPPPGAAGDADTDVGEGRGPAKASVQSPAPLTKPKLLEVMDMASSREPADVTPAVPVQAARGEHRWPVALAIVVATFLHVALPAKYRINPPWVAPAVLLGLLAALIIGDPGRIDRQKTWLRIVTSVMIACLTLANLLAAGRLVHDIITDNKLYASNATGLLATGGVIWATNVIAFGLWYWDLDRGGAAARAHHPQASPAFIFPEMLHTTYVPATWVPQFVDYLSLGFWTATAFSPADISAVKPWAKLMMIAEAAVSVVIGALVIARAINILA